MDCFVYVIESDATAPNGPHIRAGGHLGRICKIGITSSIHSRMSALRTSSPSRLTLCYQIKFHERKFAFDVEKMTHERLKKYKTNGEWFFIYPVCALMEIESCIQALAQNYWGWTIDVFDRFLLDNNYSDDYAASMRLETFGFEASI